MIRINIYKILCSFQTYLLISGYLEIKYKDYQFH